MGSPREAMPPRVVRAARKHDRDSLIRLVIDYTKRERADVSVGEPSMVKSWLAICRLASRIGRAAPTRRAKGAKS